MVTLTYSDGKSIEIVDDLRGVWRKIRDAKTHDEYPFIHVKWNTDIRSDEQPGHVESQTRIVNVLEVREFRRA